MKPVASIIVLAYGNRRATEVCLQSIEMALGADLGEAYELVLVDNDSPDDTADLFAEWSDRATVISMPENRNFSGGCNAGARAARGEVLIFLNNDTEVPPGTIEGIVEQAREPGVGAVGVRLLYPDGTIQHAGVVHKEWREGLVLPLHLFHHEAGDLPAARAIYDLDAVTGACLAMPADLFHELAGFDERYANGLEDIDLCLRVRTAGRRVVYRGDVHVLHHERLTRGAHHDERANAAVFRSRWKELLADDGDTLSALFGIGLGAIPPEVQRSPRPEGAPLAIAGRLRSPAPEGFEARALLGALVEAGLDVAAREWFPVWELSGDGGPHWNALAQAVQRAPHPSAADIRVPGGVLWSLPAGTAAVARIAVAPATGAALDVDAVWAASPELADELVEGGFPRAQVAWLPPVIPDGPAGPGGDGILALVPAHDLGGALVLLEALATLAGERVRLLPNVANPAVAALVAEHLPEGELLAPTTDERVVRELAATADVVCGDDGDRFERRLLMAAGSGAFPVARPGGACAAVLGESGATASSDAPLLASALEQALAGAGGRKSRAKTVRDACGPVAQGPRLRELVEQLETRRAAPGARAAAPAPAFQ